MSKSPEMNKTISNFLVRDKPIALEFVISPTCSYQTTFELLRKASLKLLTFKTVFDFGFRQEGVTFMFGPFP